MCAQCVVNPTWFKQKDGAAFKIGGLGLMLATKDHWDWKSGEFGLIEANDPTFTFTFEPESDTGVDWDLDRKILSSIAYGGSVFEQAQKFYKACLAEGYDPSPEADEFFNEWLSKKVKFALTECIAVKEEDSRSLSN